MSFELELHPTSSDRNVRETPRSGRNGDASSMRRKGARAASPLTCSLRRRRWILLALRRRVRLLHQKTSTVTGYSTWNAESAAAEMEAAFGIPSSATFRFFRREEEMAVFRLTHGGDPTRRDYFEWFRWFKGPRLP